MTCIYGDMNIEIGHEFDLDTFDPIVDGDTNIQANASFKQDINTVKDSLINLGYSCE